MKRKLEEFDDLTPAEERLRDEIGLGGTVKFGDGELPPEDAGPDRTVTAAFIRYLMLGGCDALLSAVPEIGVRVKGAWIIGVLDLKGVRCSRSISLVACRFNTVPVLSSAEIDGLYLDESSLPGLEADGLNIRGDASLMRAQASGEIRVLGAKIGGDLNCSGATLTAGAGRAALAGDGMHTTGDLFLDDGLTAKGGVRLIGARIGGNLCCDGATINAGQDGKALIADSAEITGGMFLRDGAKIEGELDLTAAQLGWINDERASWPTKGNLLLNRCRYGAFLGQDISAEARIAWLNLQDPAKFGKDFWPQPWEQCAKVLREMGHTDDARAVLIDKEKRQRAARRARAARWKRPLLWVSDMLMGATTRYGRRPMLAFLWLFGFWLLGAALFQAAASQNAIKPNNPFVLRSAEWAACAPDYIDPTRGDAPWRGSGHTSQLECFLAQPEADAYPKFSAAIYSADTLLPIVAMEMQEFWIPDERHGWGWGARLYLWLHIALGWALSLLAVAGFSGLIKSD